MPSNIHDLHDVFTPTKPALLTFVERIGINNKLVRALRTPGKQIVVYGHSGSGKTTLLINKLYQTYENHITTRCLSSTTFDQMILDAFDQLNPYYDAEILSKKKLQVDAGLQAEYLGIKFKLGTSRSEEREQKTVRMLPPQLTPQRLARFIGSTGCCWVVEDFHKVEKNHMKPLAETMKIFTDMSVDFRNLKLIALGAVATARDVIAYDSNMKGRVSEIHVPLMDDNEIRQIITLGEGLLNVSFPIRMKNDITKYSNGIASVCHQLALNTCDAHGLYETLPSLNPEKLTSNDFAEAIEDYVEDESDSLTEIFDKALKRKRKRKYDNCRLILRTLAMSNSKKGLTKGELIEIIRCEVPEYPAGNLTLYLEQLQDESRSTILRYDSVSGKYDYANPFHKVFAHFLLSPASKRSQQIDLSFTSNTLSLEKARNIIITMNDVAERLSSKIRN